MSEILLGGAFLLTFIIGYFFGWNHGRSSGKVAILTRDLDDEDMGEFDAE